jgi:hypothetical protein
MLPGLNAVSKDSTQECAAFFAAPSTDCRCCLQHYLALMPLQKIPLKNALRSLLHHLLIVAAAFNISSLFTKQ